MSLFSSIESYLANLSAADAENQFAEAVEMIKEMLKLEPSSGGVLLLKALEESGFPHFHCLMQELQ